MVAWLRASAVSRWGIVVALIAPVVVGSAFPAASAASAVPSPVSKYAPRVWLHTHERFQPVSAIYFITRSRLIWHRGLLSRTVVDSEISVADMAKLGAACVLIDACYQAEDGGKFWSSAQHTRPHDGGRGLGKRHGFALDYGGSHEGQGISAPVYYIYRPRRYITYWFHYAYSRHIGVGHEGDWEHITVLLDAANRAWRLQYFFHSCSDWAGMDADRRPEVFSAKNSHATYLTSGRHSGACKFTDVASRGKLWPTWRSLRNAEEEPWYGFGGAWGTMGKSKHLTGPLGPSRFKPNCDRC